MRLSKRLAAAASMVTRGNIVADVGTDHAFLPVKLVEEGVCPRAIAMDIRSGPLARAAESVRAAKLQDKIELRLSDGLQMLCPGEAQSVTITGMGGPLICRILTDSEVVAKSADELILSPQSEIFECRVFLASHGYRLTDEQMVFEDGKYYIIMKVVPQEAAALSESELRFGPVLLRQKPQVFLDYLDWRAAELASLREKLKQNDTPKASARAVEVEEELSEIRNIRWEKL